MEINATGKNSHWHDYCGPDHTYIKGPIEGWKGVKNGIIKIENEDPIPFKDWLQGLKDERWPAAWERFWKNEIYLKNIGFNA
jgi:hypothetical protein